ncbi:MAG: PTH1 family peptidyl-tRNA hydrolase [Patiriisocius sp.]|jgi:PTH1 family peptidyl-tRNA hydrolase
MFYIVGLGNPGTEYENTRHNVGWMVLDYMVAQRGLPSAFPSSKFAGRISEGVLGGEEVTLLYPDTFMNKSGSAVKKLVPKGSEGSLVVVYDDVDLPTGEIKISSGRGDGGHNGIKSIIASLGTKDFARVRVGIAPVSFFGATKRPKGARLPKHVLGDFKKREQKDVEQSLMYATKAVECLVSDGLEKTMNQYN